VTGSVRRVVLTLSIVAALRVAWVAAFTQDAFATPVTAHYYVDPAGSDTNTCRASGATSACRTIGHAVSLAQARLGTGVLNVSIALAAGTYTEDVLIPSIAEGKSLSIVGAPSGSTIHGEGDGSVITVTGGTVSITRVTITGGDTTYLDPVNGFSFHGGGIDNSGTLSVNSSTITGNAAGLQGGGISSSGVLTVTNSTVSNNTVATDPDEFDNSVGGGIHSSGTLTIAGSTISGNTARRHGGGIDSQGPLTITNSTISGNTAGESSTYPGFGGGLYAAIDPETGSGDISNSTFTGNNAVLGDGGAIYSARALTLTQSTLAHNSAHLAGGISSNFGTFTAGASLFLDSPCLISFSTLTDNGFNVTDDDSCGFGASSLVSTATALHLRPLAANGSRGPHTMAITTASSAHSFVPVASCLATDERGKPRPGVLGAMTCDAGAYELQPAQLALSPMPFDYGTVSVGGRPTQQFRLVNSGGTATGALLVTLSGSTAFTLTADLCSAVSLGGGKSCTITVQFAPTMSGTVNADLSVASKTRPPLTVSNALTGEGAPTGRIYWTNTGAGTIQSANLDGSDPVTLESGLTSPTGIAVTASHIYWIDSVSQSIQTANLDGSNPVTLGLFGPDFPGGIAVDSTHIYYTLAFAYRVMSGNLDLSGGNLLAIGEGSPFGIAVNASHVYWVSILDAKVRSANLDGSDPVTLESGQNGLNGIAADASHIYWTSGPGAIQSANLDGTNPVTLESGGSGYPTGIAVDASHIYWTNPVSGTIQSANLDGSNPVTLESGQNRPSGIAVGP